MSDLCDVDGCNNPARRLSAGWCDAHYQRFRQFGTPMADTPIRECSPRTERGCSVDDCYELHYARDLCASHYKRWMRTGDPLPARPSPTPEPAPAPAVTLDQLPHVDPDDDSWMTQAACRDLDADLWYPTGWGGKNASRQIVKAKQICQGCPVRLTCVAWALHYREDDGVWGGLVPAERRKLTRAAREAVTA